MFLLLTTDDTDYTVFFKAIAHSFTRWPLAASHDGRRMTRFLAHAKAQRARRRFDNSLLLIHEIAQASLVIFIY